MYNSAQRWYHWCSCTSSLCVHVTTVGPSVMASGVTGSVSVALHPLVILNISDHWIRIRSQEGRPMQGTHVDASVRWMLCLECLEFSVTKKPNKHNEKFLYPVSLSDRSSDREAGGEKHWGDELLWVAVSHHRWPSAYWQGVLLHQGGAVWVLCVMCLWLLVYMWTAGLASSMYCITYLKKLVNNGRLDKSGKQTCPLRLNQVIEQALRG